MTVIVEWAAGRWSRHAPPSIPVHPQGKGAVVPDLFEPIRIGRTTARNRIVVSPCTRHRARIDEVATPVMATYYGQRATAGMIVSEAINPSPLGRAYYFVPALITEEQQRSWVPVTAAVRQRGGFMFAQLMHAGRLSFPELLDGHQPIAPSAVRPDPSFRGYMVSCPRPEDPYPTPRTLREHEVRLEVSRFAAAARRAVAAGFAGVEVHAANGYLPMQFLSSNTNQRTDRYGGTIENRARFLAEVVDEVSAAIGPDRLGVKLSPGFQFHDVRDEDPLALYTYVAGMLSRKGIAYVHVSDLHPYFGYETHHDWYAIIRREFDGVLIANGGITFERGRDMVCTGAADAISFGTAFIANPDLPERFRTGAPLNRPNPGTFYTQGEAGYLDYPTLAQVRAAPTATGNQSHLAEPHPGA